MSISVYKTFLAGETLSASDLNASLTQIVNNGLSLVSPLTGSLDADGQKIILDGDQDTSITSDTDDQIDFEAGGSDIMSVVGTVGLLIGDTANSSMTLGLTINQGANDDLAFDIKSSDIAHGGAATGLETDSYFAIQKVSATLGGALLYGVAEIQNIGLQLFGTSDDDASETTPDATNSGPVLIVGGKHDGADGASDPAADQIIISFAKVTSSSTVMLAHYDEDGDHFLNGAAGSAFDALDDAAMIRGLELARADAHPQKVRLHSSRFDDNRYSSGDIKAHKLLGVDDSMVNASQLARLHSGAIWQMHEYFDALIDALPATTRNAWRQQAEVRGLPLAIFDWGRGP